MKKKPFKILSIDGGGIKGLYSASILNRLEEKSGKKTGDCFDMICGTSTGGIIALGIASGLPAKKMVELYQTKGKEIFSTKEGRIIIWWQRKVLHFFKQTLFYGKFSSESLKKTLHETFGELTLGELNNLVCIPSYSLINGMPRVFKFPHKEGGFTMDKNIPLVEVALATSAAPTFFPIHKYNNNLFIDGGIWANNPSQIGLLEAIRFFISDETNGYSHIELLSIPSISNQNGWIAGARRHRSFIGWRNQLFDAIMDGQAYSTDFFLKHALVKLIKNSLYVRLDSPKLSISQMKILEMDRADAKAICTLIELGDHDGYTYSTNSHVMDFYNTDKTYNTQ
ncbi:MAG: CBASS cGAMP-activated phospholipase [Bacteroidales bacterium]